MFGFLRGKHKNEDFFEAEPEEEELKAYLQRPNRENSYKEAAVTFPSGYKIRGIVVDYSEGGVRMRFQNHEPLPDFVYLEVPALRIRTQARVVWRDAIDFGMEFLIPEFE